MGDAKKARKQAGVDTKQQLNSPTFANTYIQHLEAYLQNVGLFQLQHPIKPTVPRCSPFAPPPTSRSPPPPSSLTPAPVDGVQCGEDLGQLVGNVWGNSGQAK